MRWWVRRLEILLFLCFLPSCVRIPDGEQLSTYVERLNARGVQSCLFYSGHASAYFQLHGVTATGGIPLATCLKQQTPLGAVE